MIFHSLSLTRDGFVIAHAEGHPTEVVTAFRNVAATLLSGTGRWRITEVLGTLNDSKKLDSEMEWTLTAKLKN